ncbi:hypothetical protein SUDANB145_02228 [Streptomyces sp. enrichment culture]|uniref:hypothetical protein n=1 Tax=Streptomyces sp. enrichment culture TaxID=1795815 RepID=UPI003F580008
MTLVVPPLTSHDVDLIVPATLQGNTAEERISKRLKVTEPYVTRLTFDQLPSVGVNPALLASLSPDDDYFVLAFVCTYRPVADGDTAAFVESRVGVQLSAPGSARPPVALALSPDTASAASGRSLRFAVTVPLVIAEPSVEYASDGSQEEQYIAAYGRGHSDPEWLLRDAPGHPLSGDFLLAMVVGAPANAAVQAEVIVAASMRRLKLLRSRAELPPAVHTIDLPATARPALLEGTAGELSPGTR